MWAVLRPRKCLKVSPNKTFPLPRARNELFAVINHRTPKLSAESRKLIFGQVACQFRVWKHTKMNGFTMYNLLQIQFCFFMNQIIRKVNHDVKYRRQILIFISGFFLGKNLTPRKKKRNKAIRVMTDMIFCPNSSNFMCCSLISSSTTISFFCRTLRQFWALVATPKKKKNKRGNSLL